MLHKRAKTEKQHYRKKSLYFKSGKRGIIKNKGAQNASRQESASDVESDATQRGRDISEMRERHTREVDAQKRRLLELADRAPEDIPPDLGEHIESDDPKQRIIHQEGLYAQSRT
jgi:hypothetical protein